MLKSIIVLLSVVSLAAAADVFEKERMVLGEKSAFSGYAEGIVSNVANHRFPAKRKGSFISCEIDSFFEEGTTARCAAELTLTQEEVSCITDSPEQIQAISSLGESSFVRFEYFGPICTRIVIENGSQYGAKEKWVR